MTMLVFRKLILILTVVVLGFMMLGMAHQPSSATTLPDLPEEVRIRCEADELLCRYRLQLPGDDIDIEVLRQGPLPTAAPSTIRIPPRTVTVRPPRATVRVPGPVRAVPGPTSTVRGPVRVVPGPTETATEIRRNRVVVPGPTETITVVPEAVQPSSVPQGAPGVPGVAGAPAPQITATSRPRPTITVTDGFNGPTVTQTEIAPPGTGQTSSPRGTLTPEPKTDIPGIQFPDLIPDLSSPGPVQTVGLSLIGLIAFITLAVGAMYVGYMLGWKESDKNNASFLRSLRDQLAVKK